MQVQPIIEKLEQMNSLHGELLKLAEHKRAILVVNQIDELTKVVATENRLIKQITESESQWVRLSKEFIVSKGIQPEANVTMNDLLKLVFDPIEKNKLQDLQTRLLATIEELKKLNAFNQQLIESSLAFVNYSLDLVAGPEDDTIYRKPDSFKRGNRRGVFDTRA